jgi:glycosyltransferase involved in cell wall biosynthesis
VDSRFFPKISIVTPSYNQGIYLEKTIVSILSQNYPNLEYLVIDGDSCDRSIDIIRSYESRITFWVSEPDTGQSNAINKGLQRATGELFGWVNSDDCLAEGALHAVAEMYRLNPVAGAFIGAGDYVDRYGRVLMHKTPTPVTYRSLYDWLELFHFMQPSCFFTRTAWERAGGLDESINFAMDLDLWFKIAQNFNFELTDTLFSKSLVHGAAKTKRDKYLSEVDAAFVIMRHGGDAQARKNLDRIAAKLDFFEQRLGFITDTRIFNLLLPRLKRLLGYTDGHGQNPGRLP